MAEMSTTKKVIIVVGVVALIGLGIYLIRKRSRGTQDVLKDVFDNLTFETGKDVIKTESFPFLDELAGVLAKAKDWKLLIVGHTDDVGSDAFNLDLSKRRANSVKNYLVSKGVVDAMVTTDGKGETMPLVPNDSAENRATNRRVAFTITKPDNTIINAKK
jgi:outer membrane protein OmpA-like peptidoglycan-associated protein